MNERIQELAVKAKLMAEEDTNRQISYNTELKAFAEKFAELIVEDALKLLKQEWYDLNNIPLVEGENTRDVGIRVGRKSEIIVLLDKIRTHFGVEE